MVCGEGFRSRGGNASSGNRLFVFFHIFAGLLFLPFVGENAIGEEDAVSVNGQRNAPAQSHPVKPVTAGRGEEVDEKKAEVDDGEQDEVFVEPAECLGAIPCVFITGLFFRRSFGTYWDFPLQMQVRR